ncbi:MAG: exonuclease SbcCD subunit D C-terminal domain-containing protein [Thiotrichales bacterium]
MDSTPAATTSRLRVLHTSDWHLGRTLGHRKRYAEFDAFLDWLLATIVSQRIDLLLVAGDVFDTGAPSNRAQGQYYRFLNRVTASPCRHVVVIAGNHDSPTFLDAPAELLRDLDVHVVGAATAEPQDAVRVLRDSRNAVEAIVCAVPYLRDRDLRTVDPDESVQDKDQKLLDGIRAHYQAVCDHAERIRVQLPRPVPLIAMGHLFTAGGATVDGDGVRDLYVGSLVHVNHQIFPPVIDYLALGHLHVPQTVGGRETMRYSGSPLPMGFGEARQQKSVCLIEFTGSTPRVELIQIPCFQRLERIGGDWPTLESRLQALVAQDSDAWLEVSYDGDAVAGDLRARIDAIVANSRLDVIKVRNRRVIERATNLGNATETLDDLTEQEVFTRCLDANAVPGVQRPALLEAYAEILHGVHTDDTRAA